MYKNLVPAGALALAAVCFSLPVFSQPKPAAGEPVKAGFVYVSPITDAGWTKQHDEGRKAVEAALGAGVKTTLCRERARGRRRRARDPRPGPPGQPDHLHASFGYMEPTLKVAKEFPDVKFESITGYKTADNVAAANARYYEGRYLAGIAAGRMTQTGVAGYVAGFPIPEVLQGINAFTLGMRSVNPKAKSRWSGSTPGSTRRRSATRPWRCSTRTWT
jgi:basic membrane protein A